MYYLMISVREYLNKTAKWFVPSLFAIMVHQKRAKKGLNFFCSLFLA